MLNKARVAVLVSGGGTNLEALFNAQAAGDLPHGEIVLVLSSLSENFVRRWPDRIVNVHPSLIPAFCGKGYYGLKVHEAALRRGVKVTGATVHLVNEIPDGGRILLQKAVDILPVDTPETLQRRVMEQAEWVLLPRAVEQLATHIAAEKEDHL